MGVRLIAFAGLVARRYGMLAAARLARAARAWLADPANAAARDELLGQLARWSGRAAGAVGDRAAALAGEVARRRTSAAWERDLMACRGDLAAARGPARAAALVRYAETAEEAVLVVAGSPDRRAALAEVAETFRLERGMLGRDGLAPDERARAGRALDRALAAARRATA